jgi:hypothetical protein
VIRQRGEIVYEKTKTVRDLSFDLWDWGVVFEILGLMPHARLIPAA